MSFKRILALTDLSQASRSGLELADMLAARVGGKVDVGYVRRTLGLPLPEEPLVQRAGEMVREEDATALRTIAAECVAAERLAEVRTVEMYSAREGIRTLIEGARPDVAVLSALGRRSSPDTLVGGVAEYTVRAAGVPVLLCRGASLPAPARPLHVLLAADLVEAPQLPVSDLGGLFRPGDKLTIVHVVETGLFHPPALGTAPTLTAGEEADLKQRAHLALSEAQSTDHEPEIAVHVEAGRPGPTLVRLAGELDAHLLVVRTHAARPFDPKMLGPVCEYVVRRCPGPVLVLPKRV